MLKAFFPLIFKTFALDPDDCILYNNFFGIYS